MSDDNDNMSLVSSAPTSDQHPIWNGQIYAEYKGGGHSALLISTAVALNAVAVPGILMNVLIIYVSITNSSLRGTSSFLLALTAFYECVHQCGHTFFLYVAVSGTNFVPYSVCVKYMIVSYSLVLASICSISITGLDRLLQLSFHNWHSDLNKPIYLAFFVIFTLANGLYGGIKFWLTSEMHPNVPQTGYMTDIYIGEFGQWVMHYAIFWNVIGIFLYVFTWAIVKLKTASILTSSSANSKLFKSLVFIVGINIGGYLINFTLKLCVQPLFFKMEPIFAWTFGAYLGIFLNLCVSLNAPILFFNSSDYRNCFKKVFGHISRAFNRGTTVAPVTKIGTHHAPAAVAITIGQ